MMGLHPLLKEIIDISIKRIYTIFIGIPILYNVHLNSFGSE